MVRPLIEDSTELQSELFLQEFVLHEKVPGFKTLGLIQNCSVIENVFPFLFHQQHLGVLSRSGTGFKRCGENFADELSPWRRLGDESDALNNKDFEDLAYADGGGIFDLRLAKLL